MYTVKIHQQSLIGNHLAARTSLNFNCLVLMWVTRSAFPCMTCVFVLEQWRLGAVGFPAQFASPRMITVYVDHVPPHVASGAEHLHAIRTRCRSCTSTCKCQNESLNMYIGNYIFKIDLHVDRWAIHGFMLLGFEMYGYEFNNLPSKEHLHMDSIQWELVQARATLPIRAQGNEDVSAYITV